MARLYPGILDPNTKSPAERRLYEVFQHDFDDTWTIFHHVKWVAEDDQGRPSDGETDFVVAHPNYGILVIEVKGGKIHFDPNTGHYTSTDSDGNDHDIGDPFEKAADNKYKLINLVRHTPDWGNERIVLGHMVSFNDSIVEGAKLRPNAPRELIIDALDLIALEGRLRTAMDYWRGQSAINDRPPGAKRIEILVRLFAQAQKIRNPLLAENLRLVENTIITLTESQYRYLRFLRGQRRAAIAGCAGSGKTFLAVEKARQLSSEGLKVLLTCYNRLLADHLGIELGYRRQFDVYSFHQLCAKCAKDAGKIVDFDDDMPDSYFEQTLPSLLLNAIDEIGPQYDAIIVDEGQDFQPKWWDALPWLLHDPANGLFYVFFDDNQRVYGMDNHIPIETDPFYLDENCRNTQRVFDVVRQFYAGKQPLEVLGPVGQPAEIIHYKSPKDCETELRRLLHRVLHEDGFKNEDLVILTALSARHSSILGKKLGNVQLVDRHVLKPDEVWATTIRRFKGLERAVIILIEIDERLSPNEVEALMYVGTSRARVHLILLVGTQAPPMIHEKLKQAKETL